MIVGGETFPAKLSSLISNNLNRTSQIWSSYGTAEITIGCTLFLVKATSKTDTVPIGQSLPNYECVVLDEHSQTSLTNQPGELLVGGVGVFAGYLGRDDLTARALIEVNGRLFYRTGDIVRIDDSGLIHYIGRQDHQVKLRGQRIELGEIERCLLSISTISACVVIKWNDDHLVAYVQCSHNIHEQQLREHCQSHLPPHMIPSFFVILEQLPLNVNGKIDRKRLPSPDVSHLSSSAHHTNDDNNEFSQPTNDIEQIIHDMWCDILHQKQISISTSLFTIGGHSLLVMQLFHRYKIDFHLESSSSFSISTFFQHPTIKEHAHLIHQTRNIHTEDVDHHQWLPLHVTRARASYAQERIFLDEHIRFSSSTNTTHYRIHHNIYVIPLLYRLSSSHSHLSISRLRYALHSLIIRHNTLRTALYLDDVDGSIVQECFDQSRISNDMISCRFIVLDLHNNNDKDCERQEIVEDILNQVDLFDLSKGHVINCHLLLGHHPSPEDDDLLNENDWILFTLHHAAFDGASTSIFLRDLALAYDQDENFLVETNALQYIDYSVHEHCMDMTLSRQFWHDQLQGYDLQSRLALPVDRHRASADQRSGLASSIQVTLDDDICTSFLHYASSHHLTLFQLGLATFYAFLFRLTHGHSDLCVSSINANRYRNELVNMIGMFVSTLPYRLHIDDHQWSFGELVRHVQEKCVSILEHSHYPLQELFSHFHVNQSNVGFLETVFDLIHVSPEQTQLSLGETNLEQISSDISYRMAKFDIMFTLVYDRTWHDERLSCSFVCSQDLFDQASVTLLSQRLVHFYRQLFLSDGGGGRMESWSLPLCDLVLILPEEAREIEDIVFCPQLHVIDEAPASFAQARIWLDERLRFDPDHPQVAIYNMPFVYRLSPHDTLSIQQLHHALQLVVNKHPSLHTALVFDSDKHQLIQRILSHKDNNNDNRTLFSFTQSTYETDEELHDILHDERRNTQHFDLDHGLVFRCHLVHYKEIIPSNDLLSHQHLLIFSFHHALFDFLSMNIFLHDLNQAYTTSQLSTDDDYTTLRYFDYAAIEQQLSMTGAQMFWQDTLHGCQLDQPLSLPYDRHRLSNEHRTGRGTSISFDLGQHLSHDLVTYASSNHIELEHLALATYYLFLFKLTNGEQDLCIGMNTHGRYRNELHSIIGMFVNAIPVRCQLDSCWSFAQLLEHIRSMIVNCRKYSYYPLQRILSQYPHLSHPAFLDTSFEFISSSSLSMGKDDRNEIMIGDSRLSLLSFVTNINEDEVMNKFDFILRIDHHLMTNELSCTLSASNDLFNVETIFQMAQRFHTVVQQLFISVDTSMRKLLSEQSLMLNNERLLIQSINHTQTSFPPVKCIHHEFVCQVIRHPQKLAVELDDQSLTYAELLHYVQLLSTRLLSDYNILPGEVICQCVERSISMVIGMMAIEMVGGVYCPLSPRDPQHRLHALLQQTQARLVLVHWLTADKFHDAMASLDINIISFANNMRQAVDVHRWDDVIVTPSHVAYIIFTSGSTGTPKAILVTHSNLMTFTQSLVQIQILHRNDNVVQLASSSFDAHILEILCSLVCGAAVIMLHPDGNMNFGYFTETLRDKEVTHLTAVPTFLDHLCKFIQQNMSRLFTLIRNVCCVGETLSPILVLTLMHHIMEPCCIWNLYGPAEATLGSTYYLFDPTYNTANVSIGKPFPGYICLLVDHFLQPVAVYQEGELYVGGVGIFAGYLGRDDLTAKALIDIDGEVFYRTGDLVRMDDSGLIHYIGRQDHQVKLRGQRIELGEIERCLLSISTISACVVIKWNDDHLVAYVQCSHSIHEQQLREHCQSHLPPHMIPSFFVILEQLPLNVNGKIDRKRLPVPQFSLSTSLALDALLAPKTRLEQSVEGVWRQILQCDEKFISTTANFFDVGGYSLLFIQLYYRYQSLFGFGAHLPAIALFLQQPTIQQHAQLLENRLLSKDMYVKRWHASDTEQDDFEHPFVVFNENCNIILFILPPGAGGAESYFNNIVPHLSRFRLVIFNNYYMDLKRKNMGNDLSFETLAPVYIKYIKQVQHSGPYNFLGWSFGGILSFEISRQLYNAGDKVGNIFMIDSYFNVCKVAVDIGKKEEVYVTDQIQGTYLPIVNNEPFGLSLPNRTTNIVLFKANKVDERFTSDDYLKLSEYYCNSSFNNLDTIVNHEYIQVFQMYDDSHESWKFNKEQIVHMCDYVTSLLK